MPWRSLPLRQRGLIVAVGAGVALAQVRQPFPDMAWLQHLPTVALLLAAPWLLRRWPLADASVACIAGFLLLHTLAGRYIYSYVPYDAWGRTLTGSSIDAAFGWRRNGFDRLVHFAFGLLLVAPLADALAAHAGLRRRAALWWAIQTVLAVSCLYEIFEWLLTILLAPGDADAYNGQQGDPWDAQKDMAMAGIGALLACGLRGIRGRR